MKNKLLKEILYSVDFGDLMITDIKDENDINQRSNICARNLPIKDHLAPSPEVTCWSLPVKCQNSKLVAISIEMSSLLDNYEQQFG